jgi:hypothetical protein
MLSRRAKSVGNKGAAPLRPSLPASHGSRSRKGSRSGERAAPSAPHSGPPAATLSDGLRPGSLRVHDPCKRRQARITPRFPRPSPAEGPRRSRHVARGLQVLPKKANFRKESGVFGRAKGRWAWTRRNLVCGSEGIRRAQRRWGWPSCGPLDPHGADVQRYARPTCGFVPPGKTHTPSPFGFGDHGRPEGRGRRCCYSRSSDDRTARKILAVGGRRTLGDGDAFEDRRMGIEK